mgnify:FL=1
MKRIITFLMATIFLLTSCEMDVDVMHHIVENPVSAEIAGKVFQSEPEKVLRVGGNVHQLLEQDHEFVFVAVRRINSDDRSYTLHIEMVHNESFELNKRYTFIGEETDDCYTIGLLLDTDEKWVEYKASSGWIEFTDLSKGSHTYVSGKFEMECKDSDNNTIEVKNGQFGPLRVSYNSTN